MYIIKTEQSFDAAHFLAGYKGKCSNLHGHRWTVKVQVCASALQEDPQLRGMVADFGDLKRDLLELTDHFDHSLIYEAGSLKAKTEEALHEEGFLLNPVPFRPTAENFAEYFYKKIQEKGYRVKAVEVYETPNNCAIYEE